MLNARLGTEAATFVRHRRPVAVRRSGLVVEARIQARKCVRLEERLNHQGTIMLNRKAISLAAASLAIAPATLLGLGATGASAATLPAAAPIIHAKCSNGISLGNVTTCMDWQSFGRHVNFIDATATVHRTTRTLEVCIRGPKGAIKCDPRGFVEVKPGKHVTASWAPFRTEPAGTYSVQTYQKVNKFLIVRIADVTTHIG